MKRTIILALALILLHLGGCKAQRHYLFSQQIENIDNIEIVYIDPFSAITEYDQLESIATISSEQWESFIHDFHAIPCSAYFLDPYQAIEGNVIRITYKDGGYEVISEYSGLQITSNGEWKYPPYYFDSQAFNSFVEATIRNAEQ